MSCQICNSGCESCNSCESCDSCEKCDSGCMKGDKCSGCNDCQSFCEDSHQKVGSFSWGACTARGQQFFKLSTWNSIYKFICNAYAEGTKKNGGSPGISSSGITQSSMRAVDFNAVSKALNGLGGHNGTASTVSPGDDLLGSYFSGLETAANTLKYKKDQCNNCNINCDVTCDTCESCDKGCEKCNNNGNCGRCNSGCQRNTSSSCPDPPSCTSGQ